MNRCAILTSSGIAILLACLICRSIWGSFRAENNDRFHEILHGFETKGALDGIGRNAFSMGNSSQLLHEEPGEDFYDLLYATEENGAEVSVLLRVVDESGKAIPGVDVTAFFSIGEHRRWKHEKKYITDSGGKTLISGRSLWSCGLSISKRGYYNGVTNILLGSYASRESLGKGRWSSIPIDVSMTMMEEQRPHEMDFAEHRISLPSDSEWYAYDLLRKSLLPPHGTGEVSDIVFWSDPPIPLQTQTDSSRALKMAFPGISNGAVLCSENSSSRLRSPRMAPALGYTNELESAICIVNGKYANDHFIPKNQYLVIRIRSILDSKGEVCQSVYGKLRGDWFSNGPERIVSFRSWINSEPNETNLEDTSGYW